MDYDNRLLSAYLDSASAFDDFYIIDAKNHNDCNSRKNGSKPRHIMINGECVICGGITEEEIESRVERANDRAYWDHE